MKEEFITTIKEYWFKILFSIVVVALVYIGYGEYKEWKEWRSSQNRIVQTSPQPIYITGGGQQSVSPPPVYVSVAPTIHDTTTAKVEEKKDKNDPDVKVSDKIIYRVMIDGKTYELVPQFKETTKFEKGSVTIDKYGSMNIGVEVPQPQWGLGVGYGTNGVAIQADYRIGKSPFNVWGYASKSDQAIGLKFVQYNSSPVKPPKEETIIEADSKKGRSQESPKEATTK